MNLTLRPLEGEEDFWRVRAFLRDVFARNGRRQQSWHVLRWDYWWRFINPNLWHMPEQDVVFLWETPAGDIAAAIMPDNPDDVFLQMHPHHRTPELVQEMLAVAEEHLGAVRPENSQPRSVVWADGGDVELQQLLAARGYRRESWPEHQRRRDLGEPLAAAPLAQGYTVRSLGGEEELPARSWASFRAFHPDDPPERYEGWEWYRDVQRMPLYRRDLDIVAVAPDGAVAAFCTVWFDDVSRTGVFEPVGTDPAHQRRGLGKAVMTEGLRRLQRLGATLATVGSYGEPAHTLYASLGFRDYDLQWPWLKQAG